MVIFKGMIISGASMSESGLGKFYWNRARE